jgi:hypothetical protein
LHFIPRKPRSRSIFFLAVLLKEKVKLFTFPLSGGKQSCLLSHHAVVSSTRHYACLFSSPIDGKARLVERKMGKRQSEERQSFALSFFAFTFLETIAFKINALIFFHLQEKKFFRLLLSFSAPLFSFLEAKKAKLRPAFKINALILKAGSLV